MSILCFRDGGTRRVKLKPVLLVIDSPLSWGQTFDESSVPVFEFGQVSSSWLPSWKSCTLFWVRSYLYTFLCLCIHSLLLNSISRTECWLPYHTMSPCGSRMLQRCRVNSLCLHLRFVLEPCKFVNCARCFCCEGLVRTSTLYAFMQWLGRSHVLLAIIANVPEVRPGLLDDLHSFYIFASCLVAMGDVVCLCGWCRN